MAEEVNFTFVFVNLTVLCFLVSLVYAMTSCDVVDKTIKETAWSFFLMLGGICVLAVVIKVVPLIFLK